MAAPRRRRPRPRCRVVLRLGGSGWVASRRHAFPGEPRDEVVGVFALEALLSQRDRRSARIALSDALTRGPPPPELPPRGAWPDRAIVQGNGVPAGRRRHELHLSTDSKKSPSWRLPGQVPATLRLDGGGGPAGGRSHAPKCVCVAVGRWHLPASSTAASSVVRSPRSGSPGRGMVAAVARHRHRAHRPGRPTPGGQRPSRPRASLTAPTGTGTPIPSSSSR